MQDTENAGRTAEATRQAEGEWRSDDEGSSAGGRAHRGAGQGGVKADLQFAAAFLEVLARQFGGVRVDLRFDPNDPADRAA